MTRLPPAWGVVECTGGSRCRPSVLFWATLQVSIMGDASEPNRTLGLVKTNCCVLECLLGSLALSFTGPPFALGAREGRWGSVSGAGVVELASLRGSN